MPKTKRPLETTRISSRRQASKEALKQMQLLLDDEEDDAFVIPDDDDDKDVRLESHKKKTVSPIIEPPPKKKYKLSHRKSSDGNDRDVIVLKSISNSNYVPKENTLELECFVEELSDVQIEMRKKIELEEKELQVKLDELLKGKHAEVVYKGEFSSAVEVNELISNNKKSLFKPNQLPQLGSTMDDSSPSYQLVMDPRLGIIVGTVQKNSTTVQMPPPPLSKSKLQISSAVKAVATIPQSQSPTTRNMRSRRGAASAPATPIQTRANNAMPTRQNNVTATRGNTPTRGNNVTPTRSNVATPMRGNNSMPTRGNNVIPTRGNTAMLTRGSPQIASPASPTPPVIQTRAMKTIPGSTVQTRNSKTPPTGKRPVANVPSDKPKQVVDLTSDDNRNQVDNREISFNKLQGKTYPSLIVVARPHLRVSDLGADRSKLDSKVKSVLMHAPTKFTEWLIQQGLIRAEQKCPVHSTTQLKLGMYSDVSKFPFSGGYVWISECCPQRFISVFNGSIFEGSPHPPMVMLKLIYHWSCHTNVQNVTQWVKVDNLYVKGVYTWLRGVCTVAVQSRIRQLGGVGCKIEVGVISLGTTSHDGSQRQVKVEVLGILESSTKCMRLRAIEPMPDGDRNFRKKFSKILEPILQWVHPASTIVTDLTVDKTTLHHMGFGNVVQTTSNDYNNSNRTIMEYLRRIVPRMFQNTLSLLSRQIIQQFLDELVWREWFGITAQQAFDNILSHLAEQTRTNNQPSLVLKLNKVSANPFRSWNGTPGTTPTTNTAAPVTTNQPTSTTASTPVKIAVSEIKRYGRGRKSNSPQVPVVQERPTKPVSPDVPEQMVPLENYYYGIIDSLETPPKKVALSMKCPFCKSTFDNNLQLQNHLFKHAHNVSDDAYLCRYCLTSVSTANELLYHVNKFHPGETKFANGFVCLICEAHYVNPFVLGKHMSKEHSPHELPYECGSCSFRCSNHKQIIDHFYMKHDGSTTIQCPFCLKSTTIWAGGRNIAQNMHYFIQHLQKHQKKQLAKKCGKCNLWFVQKEILKEHQQKMHVSLRGRLGLVPCSSPRNGVMVPKSKMDKNPCDAEIINFASLYYNIPNKSLCKECEQVIASPKHFPSFDSCQNPNCLYSTCCANAMMTHNAKCKGLNSVIPPEKLPFEMFCVCGHRDIDGNSMAKHLATCEKKSAYSSQAEAKSATVMHSMLDILGLVRKPEEVLPPKTKEKEEFPSHDSKLEDKEVTCSERVENSNETNILSDNEEICKDKTDSSNDINRLKENIANPDTDEISTIDTGAKSVKDSLESKEEDVDKLVANESIKDVSEKENTLEREVIGKDTDMEENETVESIESIVNRDVNCQDINSEKMNLIESESEVEVAKSALEIGNKNINSEFQAENQDRNHESENGKRVMNAECEKESQISIPDNVQVDSLCNITELETTSSKIGENIETVEEEYQEKHDVDNICDEVKLIEEKESNELVNDENKITEEKSDLDSNPRVILEDNESVVQENDAELDSTDDSELKLNEEDKTTIIEETGDKNDEIVEHEEEKKNGNKSKVEEMLQQEETAALDVGIPVELNMKNESKEIREAVNIDLEEANDTVNVHISNEIPESEEESNKEQKSNTGNSEEEMVNVSSDICIQEVGSSDSNQNSFKSSNEEGFCTESVSEKVHESDLNILSSSNNATPMEVDLDSELTEVSAPMEVE